MKHKYLYAAAAALMAAIIVLAGIFVPRMLLNQREQAILSGSGLVEGKTLTPYGNDTQGTISYFRKLSDMITVLEYGSGETETRDPLDSELSQQEAEEVATKTWNLLRENFDAFGWTLLDGDSESQQSESLSIYDADEDTIVAVSRDNPLGNTTSELMILPEDPAVGIWMVAAESVDFGVAMDSALGLPILMELDFSEEGGDAAEIWQEYWLICAQTIDELYDGRTDFTRAYQLEEITAVTQDVDSAPVVSCSGTSNGLTLTVQFYSALDKTTGMEKTAGIIVRVTA
jgi:hypothetical protein